MKKIATLILAGILSMTMLVGCTSKSMKDGTYKAEFSTPDDHGWTEYVEITVKGEKITEVNFDGKNADGAKKSEDAAYEQAMKDAGSATWPKDFYSKLATSLVDKQDISKIDKVAGATTSSDDFIKLVKALSNKMSKGDTATEMVTR